MSTKRRWAPRLKPEVEHAIRVLVDEAGLRSPTQVQKALELESIELDIRTIRARLKLLLPPDDSGTWSLAEHNPEHPEAEPSPAEVAAVMPVMAAVAEHAEGRVTGLTKRQAALVCRVRAAAPTLAPWFVYRVALAYQRREARKEPTEDLDLMLAWEPWRLPTRYRLFEKWVRRNRPRWVGGHTTLVPREGGLEVSVPLIDGMWLAVEALLERATDAAVNIVSQEVKAGVIPSDEAQARAMAWLKEGLDHTILVNIHADNAEGGSEEEPNGG